MSGASLWSEEEELTDCSCKMGFLALCHSCMFQYHYRLNAFLVVWWIALKLLVITCTSLIVSPFPFPRPVLQNHFWAVYSLGLWRWAEVEIILFWVFFLFFLGQRKQDHNYTLEIRLHATESPFFTPSCMFLSLAIYTGLQKLFCVCIMADSRQIPDSLSGRPSMMIYFFNAYLSFWEHIF